MAGIANTMKKDQEQIDRAVDLACDFAHAVGRVPRHHWARVARLVEGRMTKLTAEHEAARLIMWGVAKAFRDL